MTSGHTCNVVKVIDFGVITDLKDSKHKIEVLSMLAQDLDGLTDQLTSVFKIGSRSSIQSELQVSHVVQQIFIEILNENEAALHSFESGSTALAYLQLDCYYGYSPHCKALIELAETIVNRQP